MLRNELTTAFHTILALSFCHGHEHFTKPNVDYKQTFLLGLFMFSIWIFENIYLITMKRKTLCLGWAEQRKRLARFPPPKRAPEQFQETERSHTALPEVEESKNK